MSRTVVLSLRTQKILFGRSDWLLSSVQADSSHGGGVGMKENTSRIQNSMAGFSVYLALESQSAWQIRKKKQPFILCRTLALLLTPRH